MFSNDVLTNYITIKMLLHYQSGHIMNTLSFITLSLSVFNSVSLLHSSHLHHPLIIHLCNLIELFYYQTISPYISLYSFST